MKIISGSELKDRQRKERDGFPESVGLRAHRAISWVLRAEQEKLDADAAFIFYWIAFNAAYADDRSVVGPEGERASYEAYFAHLINLDADRRIYDAIWERFSAAIRLFIDNKYVFQPFWSYTNGVIGYEDWEARFATAKKRFLAALAIQDTHTILVMLFTRLYVLRNQLVHGGATWNSKINRRQVEDGRAILAFLLPIFIDLMMAHSKEDWGAPYYPVVSE